MKVDNENKFNPLDMNKKPTVNIEENEEYKRLVDKIKSQSPNKLSDEDVENIIKVLSMPKDKREELLKLFDQILQIHPK